MGRIESLRKQLKQERNTEGQLKYIVGGRERRIKEHKDLGRWVERRFGSYHCLIGRLYWKTMDPW